jgi:hypothetical protein
MGDKAIVGHLSTNTDRLVIIPAEVVGMKQNVLGMCDAVKSLKCAVCSRQITDLEYLHWDPLTKTEYAQSGMCNTCQDSIFDDKSYSIDPNTCTCNSPCCEADVGVGIITCGEQHCPKHGCLVEPGVPAVRSIRASDSLAPSPLEE